MAAVSLAGMAAEGLVPDAPGGSGVQPAEGAAKLDANDRKRSGDATLEGDAERRVRPKVELPLESPPVKQGEFEGQEGADAEEGSGDELDKRLRALVEVAAQRKGDVSAWVQVLCWCQQLSLAKSSC